MEDVARELAQLLRTLKSLHHAVVLDVGVRVELPATAVLSTLADRGLMRPSALADALHLDLSSVSRQVSALEREGWVSRERDPADSRAALLELTPAGIEILSRVRAGRVDRLRQLLPDWSDADLVDFATSLHRFRTDLTGNRTAENPDNAECALAPATPPRTTDHTPALAGQESR